MSDPFFDIGSSAPRRADERGWLDVLYEGRGCVVKRSFSSQGVFRGLHLQLAPHRQTKLVRVVSGQILDFVADPTEPVPEVHCTVIDPDRGWVLIPDHLAHGFYAVKDTVFEYVCDGPYAEGFERGYSITALLEREFGLPPPTLSAKDAAAPPLKGRVVRHGAIPGGAA
jgi:dTDP-4-dehydrorhamnose 3,5-epimerase